MISLKAVMSMNYESKKNLRMTSDNENKSGKSLTHFFLKSDVWRMLLNEYRTDEKEKNALVLPI